MQAVEDVKTIKQDVEESFKKHCKEIWSVGKHEMYWIEHTL